MIPSILAVCFILQFNIIDVYAPKSKASAALKSESDGLAGQANEEGLKQWKAYNCNESFPKSGLDLAKRMTELTEVCFLTAVWHIYPEARQLTGEVNATPEIPTVSEGSQHKLPHPLFASKHAELKRTFVGLLALLWVLKGDHDKFVECQRVEILSLEEFNALKAYTNGVLKTDGDKEAIIVYTLINDLGKVKEMEQHYKMIEGVDSVDHDHILHKILEKSPNLVPSFEKLPQKYRTWILLGMGTDFNFAQLVQGENLPGSLLGVEKLHREHKEECKKAMDFYLIHALYDIAGAAGQFVYNGSAVMSGPLWRKYEIALKALSGFENNKSSADVYNDFLNDCDAQIFKISPPKSRIAHFDFKKAIIRICLLSRVSNDKDAQEVTQAIEKFKTKTVKVSGKLVSNLQFLVEELNLAGIGKQSATLLYYAPAVFQNLKQHKDLESNLTLRIQVGLKKMIQLFQNAVPHRKLKEHNVIGESSVYTLDIKQITDDASNPAHNGGKTFLNKKFKIVNVNGDGRAILK